MVKGKVLFWVAAVLICALDLFTKTQAFAHLGVDATRFENMDEFRSSPHHPVQQVLGDRVRFVAMLNPGMMWGKLRQFSNALLIFRIIAVVVILYLLCGLRPDQRAAQLALGGILGGATGNIHDSIRYIGVRDFLEIDLNFVPFDPFPAFNVADSAICVGVFVLAVGLLFNPQGAAKTGSE